MDEVVSDMNFDEGIAMPVANAENKQLESEVSISMKWYLYQATVSLKRICLTIYIVKLFHWKFRITWNYLSKWKCVHNINLNEIAFLKWNGQYMKWPINAI